LKLGELEARFQKERIVKMACQGDCGYRSQMQQTEDSGCGNYEGSSNYGPRDDSKNYARGGGCSNA